MRTAFRIMAGLGLVGLGYLMGSSQAIRVADAQMEDSPPSDESIKKIVEANDALKRAITQLTLDSRYNAVTRAVNPFAVLVGGLDVKEDLESGHGVDPETYATLNVIAYDLKKNRIKDDSLADWVDTAQLAFDNEGHLTYKNKVVRMYSISRLRKLNAQRMVILGENKDQKTAR